jgi:hypothetical protein
VAFDAWRHAAARDRDSGSANDVRLYYVLRSAAVPACCKPRGPAPPPLTTVIDIAAVGHRKLAAVRCHRSQRHLHPSSDAEIRAILTSPEHFHRAVPPWGSHDTTLEAGFSDGPP